MRYGNGFDREKSCEGRTCSAPFQSISNAEDRWNKCPRSPTKAAGEKPMESGSPAGVTRRSRFRQHLASFPSPGARPRDEHAVGALDRVDDGVAVAVELRPEGAGGEEESERHAAQAAEEHAQEPLVGLHGTSLFGCPGRGPPSPGLLWRRSGVEVDRAREPRDRSRRPHGTAWLRSRQRCNSPVRRGEDAGRRRRETEAARQCRQRCGETVALFCDSLALRCDSSGLGCLCATICSHALPWLGGRIGP